MSKIQKSLLVLLRLTLGWFFLYAGIIKVMDPKWSAEGFLKTAKVLPELYHWFLLPANLPWVNLLNEWGLVLLGVSLILGLWVRWSALLGVVLMVLYYLPGVHFPYVGDHSLLVDEHIIYIIGLLIIVFFRASYYYGLDGRYR